MALPRINVDPATPDSLYAGAQKINQVIEVTEKHIDDKNNPHQVTADQIGAAPINHTHTPEEIGAAPLLLLWMGVM